MGPTPDVRRAISLGIPGHHRLIEHSKFVNRVTLPEKVHEFPQCHRLFTRGTIARTPHPYQSMDNSTAIAALCDLSHTRATGARTYRSARRSGARPGPGLIAFRRRHGARPVHSITAVAMPRSGCGTSIPSAVAVLTLKTRSNVVGCCTGRSGGFAPSRMRPT
jgi:hypothetical protein